MRAVRRAACAAILVALWPGTARADSHAIAVTSTAPAMLTAELSTPRSAGPFPAVILLHGCAGVGANIKEWAVWLNHEGYAAFAEVRRRTIVQDARGGLGATIEYNPRAREDAEKQVRTFLAANLKP